MKPYCKDLAKEAVTVSRLTQCFSQLWSVFQSDCHYYLVWLLCRNLWLKALVK